MDGNIITSALGSQKLINFQQLMVVGGKGLVNNFLLHLCFFFFLQIIWDSIIICRFLVSRVLVFGVVWLFFISSVCEIFSLWFGGCVLWSAWNKQYMEFPRALNTLGTKFFILVVVFGVGKIIWHQILVEIVVLSFNIVLVVKNVQLPWIAFLFETRLRKKEKQET
jgi:hypothetical protein